MDLSQELKVTITTACKTCDSKSEITVPIEWFRENTESSLYCPVHKDYRVNKQRLRYVGPWGELRNQLNWNSFFKVGEIASYFYRYHHDDKQWAIKLLAMYLKHNPDPVISRKSVETSFIGFYYDKADFIDRYLMPFLNEDYDKSILVEALGREKLEALVDERITFVPHEGELAAFSFSYAFVEVDW